MNEVILHARDLAAGYDGAAVVRDVTFSVRGGEILTLVGPNGAGKSTLLKTLARALAPLAGTVCLGDAPLAELSENALAKSLSILTTERVRAELMTCADVVSTGRYPYTGTLGILSARDREAVAEAMALVHVAELAHAPFERVSDGQRQRVMLARAICQEPEVLVLDEPTSFLDVRYKVEFLTALRQLAREKRIAVVMSLHEPDCAARVSDALLCVRAGAVDRVGRPDEVLTSAYIEELYGMEPGSYAAFFGAETGAPAGAASQRFFQNRACKSFPCHGGVAAEDFNCLFCYCPLYALGEKCGGSFHYTEKGVKSCVDCAFPHRRENYDKLLARFPELAALAGRGDDGV